MSDLGSTKNQKMDFNQVASQQNHSSTTAQLQSSHILYNTFLTVLLFSLFFSHVALKAHFFEDDKVTKSFFFHFHSWSTKIDII